MTNCERTLVRAGLGSTFIYERCIREIFVVLDISCWIGFSVDLIATLCVRLSKSVRALVRYSQPTETTSWSYSRYSSIFLMTLES